MIENLRLERREFLLAVSSLLTTAGAASSFAREVRTTDVRRLRKAIDGLIVMPEDDLYDVSRRVQSHNRMTDKFPDIIVGCRSASDVSSTIRFAREHELEIAVQGGGHDVLGDSTVDGGLLLHTGLMSSINVDMSSSRVTVGAGVRAGQLNDALQEYGLAVPLGCHPNVGVAGLTLGGGLGWLLGKFGVTCDSVISFEMVTASGAIRRVSANQDSDLYWALKGGGGNFGVVASIEFQAHEIKSVTRGFVVYSANKLREFMAFYDDYMRSIPNELTVEVIIANAAEPLITVTFCDSGAGSSNPGIYDPLLKFGPPLATNIETLPYARLTDVPQELVRQFFDTPVAPESGSSVSYNYWKGASTSNWSEDAIECLNDAFVSAPDGYSIGIGHFMHGAACDIDPLQSPLIRRRNSYSYFFNANWSSDTWSDDTINWVDNSSNELSPYADATYVNYLSSNHTTDIIETYGPNYEKLVSVKRKYDPENFFRHNRNIRP